MDRQELWSGWHEPLVSPCACARAQGSFGLTARPWRSLTVGPPLKMASDRSPNVLFDLALDYAAAPRMAIARADRADDAALAQAAGFFQALGKTVSVVDDAPGLVVMRTVAMLANEAADVVHQGVASAADVDVSMLKGVNYPRGPLAWADAIGPGPHRRCDRRTRSRHTVRIVIGIRHCFVAGRCPAFRFTTRIRLAQ